MWYAKTRLGGKVRWIFGWAWWMLIHITTNYVDGPYTHHWCIGTVVWMLATGRGNPGERGCILPCTTVGTWKLPAVLASASPPAAVWCVGAATLCWPGMGRAEGVRAARGPRSPSASGPVRAAPLLPCLAVTEPLVLLLLSPLLILPNCSCFTCACTPVPCLSFKSC